jgi:hypothetical protein
MQIKWFSVCTVVALAVCRQASADAAYTAYTADIADIADTAAASVAIAVAALPAVTITAPVGSDGHARPVPAQRSPFSEKPVAADQLARMRGGTDTVWNDMKLDGAVTGNSAINVATGANTISSGSFSNAAGLPVAIQNSGANVLIQNATIINIQMQ